MKNLALICLSLSLVSCFDSVSWTYWEDGYYCIKNNPGNSNCKTLYIANTHGRGPCVDSLGYNNQYITIKSENNFFLLDKTKDNPHLNSKEIIEGPFTRKEFKAKKERLKISDLNFEFKF